MASKTTKMSTKWQKLWNIHSSYFHSCQIIDYCQNCQIRERSIKRLKRCRALEGVRVVFQQVTRAVCQIYVHSKQLKSDLLSLVFTVFYRKYFSFVPFSFPPGVFYNYRSSTHRCSMRKYILRNFTKYTGKHLCQSLFIKKKTLAQVLFCEFCEISKNIFFTEHLWTTASIIRISLSLFFSCHRFSPITYHHFNPWWCLIPHFTK